MKELFIERDGFLRIARVEDGELKALKVIKDTNKPAKGDIYSGIVRNVSKSQAAAFIDIGTGKNAYLHIKKQKDKDDLKVGDRIAVEILRAEAGRKGAKVTDQVSLTDGNIVVMKGRGYSFSKRTKSAEFYAVHDKLPQIPGIRLMIRSGSLELSPESFQEGLEKLVKEFQAICRKADQSMEPQRLYRDLAYLDELLDGLSDTEPLMIHSNDSLLSEAMRERGQNQITDYPPGFHVFHRHGLESAVERLRNKTVLMADGGSLVIEETEALTAIDVNSGSRQGRGKKINSLELNLAALQLALEQIELRNLAGIIIIDFITMEDAEDRTKLFQAAQNLTKAMKPLTKVYPLTELGLLQIARRRQGESVTSLLFGRDSRQKLLVSASYLYKLIRIRLDDEAWEMNRFEISLNPIYQLEQQAIEKLLAIDYPNYEIRIVTRPDVELVKVVPVLL